VKVHEKFRSSQDLARQVASKGSLLGHSSSTCFKASDLVTQGLDFAL